MEIVKREELVQHTKNSRIKSLKEKITDDVISELNDLLLDRASKGNSYLHISIDHPFYSKYNRNITEYLNELGYDVTWDYLGEEYDFEFTGYIIKW